MSPRFESIGLSVQEKKFKIDFQDGRRSGHLLFTIKTILALFDLQVFPILPTKFRVFDFRLERFKLFFYLQVTPIFPTKIRVNWPIGSGDEAKNRFSNWRPRLPSCISNQNDFNNF